MIESTKGIVLNYTRYAESSIISHIYTQKFGIQSYMINQVRSRKNKDKHIFLQPLSLLDLEVYHSEKKSIHRIKDFRVNTSFTQIPYEPVRRSLAFFISEVLHKALKQEDKRDGNLFDFLHQSISLLDGHLPGVQNFHLYLLFRLTRPLGCFPQLDKQDGSRYFDLKTGTLQQNEPNHPHYMNYFETSILKQLSEISIEELDTIQITQDDRNKFLEKMLAYYHLHLSGFSNIKSLSVLKEIYR